MKYILFLLISINSLAQQTTVVKVPPSKDTTIVTFKTTTTTSSNTATTYQTSFVPTKTDTVITPPVIIPGIQGYGQTKGGGAYAPTLVSTATDIRNKLKSNTNLVITKGGTYNLILNYTSLSNVTIDGSQADGPVIFNNNGADGCLIFETSGCHDIIVKSISIRSAGDDGAACGEGAYGITFDHCSFYDNNDGSIDVTTGSHDITIQWSLIGNSTSGASLFDYANTRNISVHHNLYSSFERNPLIGSQGQSGRTNMVCDFTNNVVIGWDSYGTDVNNNGTANIRNNYYYSPSNPDRAVLTAKNSYGTYPQGFAYVAGNVSGNGIDINKQSNHALWPVPAEFQVTMQDACTAAKLVLAGAGPVKKDKVDTDFIKQVVLTGCQ